MRAVARRLHRLEERFGLAVESSEKRDLRARLDAARLRGGLPPISPERLAELRGMSAVQILYSGRLRAAVACELGNTAPAIDYAVPHLRLHPRGPVQTVHDLLKHAPLLVPVDPADDAPQIPLVKALDGWQKKDLFLNVRSEIEQLHDLCHAGSRHPAKAGQFRIIPNRFIPKQALKPDGERHESGDPGNAAASPFAI